MAKYFKIAFVCSFILIVYGGCKPVPPLPTVSITSDVVNNVVTFTLKTDNSSAYRWRFGDGDSAIVYSSNPIRHAYPEDGTTYSVSLLVLGSGGQTSASTTVTIPVMSQIDKLTGGTAYPNGKGWRISSSAGVSIAAPDSDLTIISNYATGVFKKIGLISAPTDQYIFFSNGNYTISSQGGGILAGLNYCIFNNLANVQPHAADSVGLTYATPYKPPKGLKFALNSEKNLSILATTDGITSKTINYKNVTTLSFTPGGFVGLMDFMNECIVQSLTPSNMTIGLFFSDAQPQSQQVGKSTKVFIMTLENVK